MPKNTHKSTGPRMKTTITKRIVAQSIVLTTLTALILSVSAFLTTRYLLEQRIFAQLSSLVGAKEELIARRIDADRERTALLSARDEIAAVTYGSRGSADLQVILEGMQQEGVAALGVSVFSSTGKAVAQSGIAIDAIRKPITATTLVPSTGTEGWDGYTVYSPIGSNGTLAIRYSLREFLESILSVPALGKSGEVLLAKIDGDNLVLLNNAYADGKRSPLSLGSFASHLEEGLPIAEAVAKKEDMRSDSNYAGQNVYVAFRQLPTLGWGLSVSVHRTEAMRGIVYMATALTAKSVLLLFLAYYAAIIVSQRLTAPLRHLTEKMHKLGPNNWSLGRTIQTGDEVEVLERIAADMAKRLKDIYDHLEEEIEKRTEELKQQYLKGRTTLETIDQGVVMVNTKGQITDANPAALSMLRCTGDDCMNGSVDDVLDIRLHKKALTGARHPVHFVLNTKNAVRSTPEHRYSIMNADNILVPVLMVVKPLMEDKKLIGAILVFQDITEERRVDYLKSEFISLASHQLRTPLSSLQWYIELINDEQQLNEEQSEYVKEMDFAAKRMSNLIDSLLHAARLEGGDITPHENTVELTTLVTDLGEELRSMAKEKGISTTVVVPKQKVHIETDSVLLHVVFKNLFSNAVKYTMPGGKVGVNMKASAKNVEITISDNGIGIPKNDQKRLFQRLFRANNVRKMDTDGNGLGLYITKMIVESLGGTVTAKSTEGKGCTFIVKLPIKKRRTKKK